MGRRGKIINTIDKDFGRENYLDLYRSSKASTKF
jgi:hypothetical protein